MILPGQGTLWRGYGSLLQPQAGCYPHLGHEGLLQREIEKVDATPSRALLVTWPHKGSETASEEGGLVQPPIMLFPDHDLRRIVNNGRKNEA